MKTHRNTLLAGIAALAMVAGTGLASAQSAAGDQGNPGQGGAAPGPAGQSMQHNSGGAAGHGTMSPSGAKHGAQNQPQGGKAGQSAQSNGQKGVGPSTAQQNDKSATPSKRSAQELNRGGENVAQPNRNAREMTRGGHKERSAHTGNREQLRSSAQKERFNRTDRAEQRGGTANTAERMDRNGSLRGLQSNASANIGGNIRLSEEQRSRIRQTVIQSPGAPRADHVNFDIRVGTVIPRRDIRVVPVPETLVRIEPRWHRYLYFIYEDEVVIVNPRTMQIVAVLEA